jgi:hypothetical protein
LTLVPLLFFGLAAFRGKYADPSWTDVGWPFGAVLTGRYFAEKIPKLPLRKSLLIGGLVFLTSWFPIGLIAVHTFYPFLPLAPAGYRTLEMRGWEPSQEVGETTGSIFPGLKRSTYWPTIINWPGGFFYTPQHPILTVWQVTKKSLGESPGAAANRRPAPVYTGNLPPGSGKGAKPLPRSSRFPSSHLPPGTGSKNIQSGLL